MQISRKTSFAAGAVAALVLGSGTAYAATGGNFILGRANSAGTTTSLTNANGSALSLTAKAGTPALRVSNGVTVPNLNADKLDGLSSAAFASATRGKFFQVEASGSNVDVTTPNETAVVTASCPVGSSLSGGGYINLSDPSSAGVITGSYPSVDTDSPNTWQVDATLQPGDNQGNIVAVARCYDPTGNVKP